MASTSLLHTRAQLGLESVAVQVETHLSGGLPAFSIVGMPETAVKESRDRVRSALLNSRFEFPQRRITVNLAPADLPKAGGLFDLPIALGILHASGQLTLQAPGEIELLGELALNGALRPGKGVLPAALAAARAGRCLILPAENAAEAALGGGTVYGAATLLEVCAHLQRITLLQPTPAATPPPALDSGPCLADVRGQVQGRRALEVAAAGGHSLLLCGPPGSGKSMLAERLPSLLPPLDETQALTVAAIHSLQTPRPLSLFRLPPFRAPHHTASAIALTGGGAQPRPGEISLAHHGVLFLDELPEFDRRLLESLREPLEAGEIHIARAARSACFPARFQLIAAMNPCPCGWLGDPRRSCGYVCEKARRYQQKISGPLLDRIDLHVQVSALSPTELINTPAGEPSHAVRERVVAARARQFARQGMLNQALPGSALGDVLQQHRRWLEQAVERLGLSARALYRLLKVARTLADLAGNEQVDHTALREALAYRAAEPSGPPG